MYNDVIRPLLSLTAGSISARSVSIFNKSAGARNMSAQYAHAFRVVIV